MILSHILQNSKFTTNLFYLKKKLSLIPGTIKNSKSKWFLLFNTLITCYCLHKAWNRVDALTASGNPSKTHRSKRQDCGYGCKKKCKTNKEAAGHPVGRNVSNVIEQFATSQPGVSIFVEFYVTNWKQAESFVNFIFLKRI